MSTDLYLADTSVWHWSRVAVAGHVLQTELDAGRVATCAMIDAELMVSARGPDDADRLVEDRRSLRWLSAPDDVWDAVAASQRALVDSSRHRMVKIADLVIAAVAARHDAVVLHYDADYDAIADVTGQRTRWLAPRGSL